LPRDATEALGIEVAQVDDVDVHNLNLTRRGPARRAEYCIAPPALTPYL
jgi:hypothetical protein